MGFSSAAPTQSAQPPLSLQPLPAPDNLQLLSVIIVNCAQCARTSWAILSMEGARRPLAHRNAMSSAGSVDIYK
jgi:hypothetical protein